MSEIGWSRISLQRSERIKSKVLTFKSSMSTGDKSSQFLGLSFNCVHRSNVIGPLTGWNEKYCKNRKPGLDSPRPDLPVFPIALRLQPVLQRSPSSLSSSHLMSSTSKGSPWLRDLTVRLRNLTEMIAWRLEVTSGSRIVFHWHCISCTSCSRIKDTGTFELSKQVQIHFGSTNWCGLAPALKTMSKAYVQGLCPNPEYLWSILHLLPRALAILALHLALAPLVLLLHCRPEARRDELPHVRNHLNKKLPSNPPVFLKLNKTPNINTAWGLA